MPNPSLRLAHHFFKSLQLSSRRKIITIAWFITAFTILYISMMSYILYQDTIKYRSEAFSTLTFVLTKNIEQIIKKNVIQLDNIQNILRANHFKSESEYVQFAKQKKQYEWLVTNKNSDPIIDVVTMIDQNGIVLNFSRYSPPPSIDLSERDYFQYLSSHDSEKTFYSTPVKNKGNGDWVFYLAQRINGPNHEFIGIILIGISIKVFSDLFAQVGSQLGTGSAISLYSEDQVLLTRWPYKQENLGKINPNTMIKDAINDAQNNHHILEINGPSFNQGDNHESRMVTFQKVQDIPFILGISVTKNNFITEWKKNIGFMFGATFFFLILFGLMVNMLIQSYDKNVSIQYDADHDQLTGLLNRSLFQDRLSQAIAKAHREEHLLALLFIDVDKFKHINDQYGHHVGDLTLQAIAARLKSNVRDYDSIGRIGGDEFLVLLDNIGHRDNAAAVAEKIRIRLHQTMEFGDASFSLGISIGISLYPTDSLEADQLIDLADQAMYAIKQLGGNAIHFKELPNSL